MNLANTAIGLMSFLAATRARAALLSTTIVSTSLIANFYFYDLKYFFALLPFDGSLFAVSVLILIHCRRDLRLVTHERRP